MALPAGASRHRDYDAASPVVLFDTVINGEPRKGIAEAGRTGSIYILDRTNGKPLIGIEERPVPEDPRQKTAKTQPYPIGDAVVPQCADPLPGYEKAGCVFEPFWETPVLIQPSGIGGTNWSPMPYSPDTGRSELMRSDRASRAGVTGASRRRAMPPRQSTFDGT